jgi:hypothetical protein
MDDAPPYTGAYQTGVRRSRGLDNSPTDAHDLTSQQQLERFTKIQHERLSNLQRFSLLGDGERGAPDSAVDRASSLSNSALLSSLAAAGAGGLNSEDLLVRLSNLSQGVGGVGAGGVGAGGGGAGGVGAGGVGAGGVGARAFGSLGGGLVGVFGGAHSGGSQQAFSTGLPSFATGAGARANLTGSSPLGSMIGSEEGHGSRLTGDLLGLGRLSNLSAGLGARLTALGSSSGSDLPRNSKLDLRFTGIPSNLGFGALAKAGLGSSGYDDELGGYSAAAALASGADMGGSGQGGAGIGGAGGWRGSAGTLGSLYDNLTQGRSSGPGLANGLGAGSGSKPLPLKGELDRAVLQQQQLHLHMLEQQQQHLVQQQQPKQLVRHQQQHLVRQHQQMLQRRNEALQLEAAAAASRASTSKPSGADSGKGKESAKEGLQQDDEQQEEDVAEEGGKGAGEPPTKAPAKANAAGAGVAGVAGAAGAAAATTTATAPSAGAPRAAGSIRKRPPRPEYIVGLNSLDLFMSFTSEYTSPTNPNEMLFDTSEILGRECYEAWINTRRAGLKKPEESFRRALTAHVTGADRRRPFPPDVEKSLLVELRRQQTWPCFEGRAGASDDRAIKIGEQGFRTMGYHEKNAYDLAEAQAAATSALGFSAESPALDNSFLPGGNAAAYNLPYPSQRPPYLNEQQLQMLLTNEVRRVKDALEEGHQVHPSLEQLNASRASVMQLFDMPRLASGADANDAFQAAKRKASDLDLQAISGKRPWGPNAL